MKAFRTILFWCHLVTGITVGTIVFVMSVTGVLLTYQRQITTWADTRGLDGAPPAAASRPLPVDALLERASAATSGAPASPTAVTWRSERDAPAVVAFGRDRTLFLNAYTGEALGEGSPAVRRFFRVTTDLHRHLAAPGDRRAVGRAVTGAANLGFLFLVMSGFYLWWPRHWSRAALRNVVLFRGGPAGKARDFNWHNVAGVWSAVPLFIIVFSGTVISYPWMTALVYRAVGEAPPTTPAPPPARPAQQATQDAARAIAPDSAPAPGPLEPLVDAARRKRPAWKIMTLQIPRPDPDVTGATLLIDEGTGGQPQARSSLVLERATGAEARWEPFGAATLGRRIRLVLRFAHTGEVLGIVGQTIAGLASLGAALLVWTGLSLSWRRFRAWRARVRPATRPSSASGSR